MEQSGQAVPFCICTNHQFLPPKTEVKKWMAEQVRSAKPIKSLLKSNPKQQQELRYYKASFFYYYYFSEVFHYNWFSSWAQVQKYQYCLIFFSNKYIAWIMCSLCTAFKQMIIDLLKLFFFPPFWSVFPGLNESIFPIFSRSLKT